MNSTNPHPKQLPLSSHWQTHHKDLQALVLILWSGWNYTFIVCFFKFLFLNFIVSVCLNDFLNPQTHPPSTCVERWRAVWARALQQLLSQFVYEGNGETNYTQFWRSDSILLRGKESKRSKNIKAYSNKIKKYSSNNNSTWLQKTKFSSKPVWSYLLQPTIWRL